MASVDTFKCFVGPEGKDGYFGLAAYERALLAGFTAEEIKLKLKEEKLVIGEKLDEILN